MSTKLMHREMERLKDRMLQAGSVAESQLRDAVQALFEKDASRAESVIEKDLQLDKLEVEIEEECLKLLALHQPVAADLRFIIAVLKMNIELERVGDLSVDISRRVNRLLELGYEEIPPEIAEMAQIAKLMLRKGLLSVLEVSPELAETVLEADTRLDALNRSVFDSVSESFKHRTSSEPEQVLLFLIIARRLERIGDHATNVAEDLIYMSSGEIVRHRPRGERKTPARH